MAILRISIQKFDQKVVKNVNNGGGDIWFPNLVQCSLIPNGGGNCTTDWVITGGGEIDPNLADGWEIAYITYEV